MFKYNFYIVYKNYMISSSEDEVFNIYSTNFLWETVKEFEDRRNILLKNRIKRIYQLENNIFPNFLDETIEIRKNNWCLDNIHSKLLKRQVEIISPPYKKMIINCINLNVDSYICNFNDSISPTINNIKKGHINIYNALRGNLEYIEENNNYKINNNLPLIFFRPRNLNLEEKNIGTLKNKKISATLFDFCYYYFNNVNILIEKQIGPYFCIPDIEDCIEAKWWNDLLNYSEDYFCLPRGTIKVTINIQNIHAVFQAEEILFELRYHCIGLRCNNYNFITNYIKYMDNINVNVDLLNFKYKFLENFQKYLISICHKRETATFIDFHKKIGETLENKIIEKYVSNGFDGFLINDPDLIEDIRKIYVKNNILNNQISKRMNYYNFNINSKNEDLIILNIDQINLFINILTKYIDSWINGVGLLIINNLIINMQVAELCRINLYKLLKIKNIYNKVNFDIKYIINISNKYTKNKMIINLIFNLLNSNNISKNIDNYLISNILS
jgi:malate synthase